MSVYMWGLLILAALVSIYLLVRMHYRRLIQSSDLCPKCGGSKFYRVHRTTADRVLGIGLATRRFRCANPDCRWEGLRHYYPRPKSWKKSQHHSENRSDSRSDRRSSHSSSSDLSENS